MADITDIDKAIGTEIEQDHYSAYTCLTVDIKLLVRNLRIENVDTASEAKIRDIIRSFTQDQARGFLRNLTGFSSFKGDCTIIGTEDDGLFFVTCAKRCRFPVYMLEMDQADVVYCLTEYQPMNQT